MPDIVTVIFAIGVVLWFLGAGDWLEEKTRQLRLDNDQREQKGEQ